MNRRAGVGSLIAVAFWAGGCSPYYTAQIRDWRPSEIELPKEIKKVALVNRSTIPEQDRKRIMEEYKKRGVIQGATYGALTGGLSGAAFGATSGALGGILDEKWLERAPQQSLQHLHQRLSECGRFEPIMAGQELKWVSSAEGSLPSPLPLDSLKRIHKQVPNAQAILVLEMLLPGGSPQNPEALAGFRLYDPKTGKVIDEATTTASTRGGYYYRSSNSAAEAHMLAVEKYIHRICPCFPYYETRSVRIFVKGSPELEQAKAAVIGRNWNEAIALWERAANSGKKTAAKRAAYNLAVLYDALCEVEKAEEWYKKAVAAGLGAAEYENWGRTRRNDCQRLNAQLPRDKRSY
ncbi:MAG: tetratricopeptide repeat protein [Bacteroidia bacterium]|nr:tetratricopeptide repeat protein [Bacteroidia bacterium]MCX7764750.1 tetratricopeptide repeat protein [Bacteroidia bacterium]MDW8058320.1 DUF6340 family protein [Bacteroidia bacterium]